MSKREPTNEELKDLIRCIHEQWYKDDWIVYSDKFDPKSALKLHKHMSALFNYAGIKSTLVKNNPDEMSPEEFKIIYGVDE